MKSFKDNEFVDLAFDETIKSIKRSDAKYFLRKRRIDKLQEKEAEIKSKLYVLADNPESYNPKTYSTFNVVENGKERLIESISDEFDKVVAKSVTLLLQDILNPMLMSNSFCNVAGRGIGAGVNKIKKTWLKEERKRHFRNKRSGKETYAIPTKWVFKMDIHHYYPSIDRRILREKLERKIKDKHFIDLIYKFIDKYVEGLGIGGGMCAVLANFYLKDVDDYIMNQVRYTPTKFKRKSDRGGYVFRYMDDIVVFARSKTMLKKIKEGLEKEILPKLKLEIKKNWYIAPFYPKGGNKNRKRNLDFMGFVFDYKGQVRIRKRSRKKIIRLLRKAKRKGIGYLTGKNLRSLMAYNGMLNLATVHGRMVNKYLGKGFRLKRQLRFSIRVKHDLTKIQNGEKLKGRDRRRAMYYKTRESRAAYVNKLKRYTRDNKNLKKEKHKKQLKDYVRSIFDNTKNSRFAIPEF